MKTYRISVAEGAGYIVKQLENGEWMWEFREADDTDDAFLDSSSVNWSTPWDALRGVADDAEETISRVTPAIRNAKALATRLERAAAGVTR